MHLGKSLCSSQGSPLLPQCLAQLRIDSGIRDSSKQMFLSSSVLHDKTAYRHAAQLGILSHNIFLYPLCPGEDNPIPEACLSRTPLNSRLSSRTGHVASRCAAPVGRLRAQRPEPSLVRAAEAEPRTGSRGCARHTWLPARQRRHACS